MPARPSSSNFPMTTTDGWVPSKIAQERLRYRRARSRRSTLIAAISTVVLVAVVAVAVVHTQGWPRFKASFLDLKYGWQVFPDILKGLWLNVRLMVICEILILVLAMLLAVARSLRGPVFFPIRAAATVYTDIFRGLPLLLVLYLLGFGVPALRITWLTNNSLIWGGVGLVLTYTAYNAEVLRAGMESVHPSQRAAARSLGLSHGKTMRYVVIPQAFRRVMPPLLNDLVSLQKDTALIAALGTPYYDAVLQAQIDNQTTYNYTPYVVAGLLFLVLTIPMTRFTDWIARKQGWINSGATI
jgi:polar amino acid transport system permease protein